MEFIDWLKERLKTELPGIEYQLKMVPSQSREMRFKPMKNPKQSSVLLLLFKKDGAWHTVFIKRTEYKGMHSGQISLPGGKQEDCDENLAATALRETFEEVGVNPEDVRVLGKLSTVQIPVSGFIVEPYVGYISYEPEFKPDIIEVQEIIISQIELFLRAEVKGEFTYKRDEFSIKAPYYNLLGEKLWGATAMMISEFEELCREYSA